MAQPGGYQQMLNYLLPTKRVGGEVYVPRLTQNSSALDQLNDFDHWHNQNHTHIGIDLAYSRLNPLTGAIDYLPTRHAANQNVSVGAPISGVVHVVGGKKRLNSMRVRLRNWRRPCVGVMPSGRNCSRRDSGASCRYCGPRSMALCSSWP